MKTIQEVEQYAAAHGVTLTPADKAKIGALQQAERERLIEINPERKLTRADRWNRFYPVALKTIITVGETLLTFAQTVIVSLGIPLVLILLLIVEQQRVLHGIALFESDRALAEFAATALVLLNLVLEFQVHYIEDKAGYQESQASAWSFRIGWQSAAYTLGFGETWIPRALSPANRYKRLLRLVTFTILSLALVGSMRAVIEVTNGAWYEAVVSILTDSSLLLMMTWLGGLLFAAAAVLSAQGLSRYVAIRCVEIIAHMQAQKSTDDPYAADIEQTGATAALAFVNAKLEKKPKAPVPFGHSHPVQDESEFMQIPLNGNGYTANGNGKNGTK